MTSADDMRPPARIRISGTPEDIGRAHGEALKAQIHETIGIYSFLFGKDENVIEETALRFREKITDFAPRLAREIDAIAAAADVSLFWLYALNARSEILSRRAPECTALYTPDARILAQNWDWMEPFERLFAVLDITHEDGRRILTVTEPGVVGKVGLNTDGLGVCLNFMIADASLNGVPIHILLRALLDAASYREGLDVLERAGAGRAGNILFASRCGGAVSVEYAGAQTRHIEIGECAFAHTNHPVQAPAGDGDLLQNSAARLRQADALLEDRRDLTLSEAAAILSNIEDGAHPICMSYRPFEGVRVGTVCSILMELDAGRLHLRKGPNPEGPFETYSF